MFRQDVTECKGGVRIGIGYDAVYTLFHLVDGHGGAVIVKEIVSVNPVFNTAVLNK